jgi:hypothetical protein
VFISCVLRSFVNQRIRERVKEEEKGIHLSFSLPSTCPECRRRCRTQAAALSLPSSMRTFAQAAAAKEMAEAVVGGIRHLTDDVLHLGIFRAALPLTPFFSFPLFLRFFFWFACFFTTNKRATRISSAALSLKCSRSESCHAPSSTHAEFCLVELAIPHQKKRKTETVSREGRKKKTSDRESQLRLQYQPFSFFVWCLLLIISVPNLVITLCPFSRASPPTHTHTHKQQKQ